MAFTAVHRFARISPRKVRPLAELVRGKFVDDALDALRYQPHRGARLLEKVVRSAVANAQDPDQNPGRIVDPSGLYIAQVWIDGGPIMKRMRPRARGVGHLIKRRSAHIRVELDEV
jgi:large subunit ribosomal protein L22